VQGTVNPTHYIVLKNGCNLSVENVQRLSYKLCHLYYNWCGTVKVPAPVQVNIKFFRYKYNIFCWCLDHEFQNRFSYLWFKNTNIRYSEICIKIFGSDGKFFF